MTKIFSLFLIIIMFIFVFLFFHQQTAVAREQYPGQFDNVDPKTKAWYKSLFNDRTGIICCDVSDCSPVEMAYVNDKYYAILDSGIKIEIPPNAILSDQYESTNPTGKSVVCYREFKDSNFKTIYNVRCFVRGNWS